MAVLALVFSLVAVALPASAHLEPIDTSASCPNTIPNAGFTDIGGFNAETQAAINCLAHYGITKGTSATTFSPDLATPRWQMALFLIRQAATHGLTIPAATDQGFTDISGQSQEAQDAINQLAALGLTKGTSATTFSPNLLVSRWQMALFIHRLAVAAGVTFTDDPAHSEFTDISGQLAEAQTAINALADAHIALGVGAGLFAPEANVLRWQMALFLTRLLAADGIVPSGIGAFVTRFNAGDNTADRYQVADTAGCTTTLVSYAATGTTFSLNGAPATKAAFEAALAGLLLPGNVIRASSSATHHSIETGVTVASGLIGVTDFTTGFSIIEPVTGSVLRAVTAGQAFDSYSVDGVAAAIGGFSGAVSVGDSVSISGGTGASAAQARSIALTNGTVSGNVSTVAAPVIDVDTACPSFSLNTTLPVADTHTYTVDGAASTQALYIAAASNNDLVTYARNGGASTWTLTNQAPAAISGLVYTIDTGAGTENVGIAVSSTSATGVDYTGVFTLRVNGSVATEAEFVAALTLADSIVFQPDNPATAATDESALNLTDAIFSGRPNTYVAPALTVLINGQVSDAVDVTDPTPTGIASTAATVAYQVNGGSATLAQFEAGVNFAIANAVGTVTATQTGTVLTFNVTTS